MSPPLPSHPYLQRFIPPSTATVAVWLVPVFCMSFRSTMEPTAYFSKSASPITSLGADANGGSGVGQSGTCGDAAVFLLHWLVDMVCVPYLPQCHIFTSVERLTHEALEANRFHHTHELCSGATYVYFFGLHCLQPVCHRRRKLPKVR